MTEKGEMEKSAKLQQQEQPVDICLAFLRCLGNLSGWRFTEE